MDYFKTQIHPILPQNPDDLIAAVQAIKFKGGNTYTHRALQFVSKHMLTKGNGTRDGVAKMVVIITDGQSVNFDKTVAAADAIKATGVLPSMNFFFLLIYILLYNLHNAPFQ